MNVYEIIELGSCAITRRLTEIDMIFESHIENIDATAHDLWDECELLLDSLYCIADGMSKSCV